MGEILKDRQLERKRKKVDNLGEGSRGQLIQRELVGGLLLLCVKRRRSFHRSRHHTEFSQQGKI